MSSSWGDDDEELRAGAVKGVMKAKPRFSFTEVKMLLEAVKSNRYIILRKFNHGVSAETKKQTWAEITDQINGLGENHREVRQIMKKWADLKCDGKRRMAALRGPNGNSLRKKRLGPVEKMVHKILLMSPGGDGDSDLETFGDDDFSNLYSKGPSSTYLSLTDSSHSVQGGASFDISPLSSPEKEFGEHAMDFEENDDSSFSFSLPPPSTSLDPLPDDALTRIKPVYTYSRGIGQNQNNVQNDGSSSPPPGPSSSTSSEFPPAPDSNAASSSVVPPLSQSSSAAAFALPAPPPPSASSSTSGDTTSPTSTSIPPPPAPPPASTSAAALSPSTFAASTVPSAPSFPIPKPPPSSSVLPPNIPSTLSSNPADPLPEGASTHRSQDQVAQLASQSLQQQRASRMLLSSVSQSLEILAQSVQLLVESQQEFVQESLLLQRETVDILRDFSNTALTMLRDKSSSGQMVTRHHPSSHF